MKPPVRVIVPPGVVTTTFAAPAAWAGVTAVRAVELVTVTLVAATPPKVTAVLPATKLVPVMVTVWPPEMGPAPEAIEAIAGGSW